MISFTDLTDPLAAMWEMAGGGQLKEVERKTSADVHLQESNGDLDDSSHKEDGGKST